MKAIWELIPLHKCIWCVCVWPPGPQSNHRPKEDPWCSSTLHHPQHHGAGQTQPGVSGPCAGRPAGGAGQPGPAAEHPQPERGAGHQPKGWREAGEEEEEKTEQPQPSELPEEEEERGTNTATEEDRARGEKKKKSTQETKDRGRK